ncbi:MBL fold metallo-hydrolase [Candidatus Thorarchaeota archaeon]|nr:MAG: MBL fold metallo-hydrolase [Candidatus Thorarchaeota archaeon]
MPLEKVTDHILAETSGENGGNMGVVILNDQVVIIDSGMFHQKTKEIRIELEEYELPIRNLILTHAHSDHVFGAQAFDTASIISSEGTRDYCVKNLEDQWDRNRLVEYAESVKAERPELFEAMQDLKIRIPDVVFKRHLSVGPDMELRIEHVGGHTAGSTIVAVPSERISFVGDLIFNGSFPYAADPTCDPERWIMALEKVLAGRYDLIIPGHGPACGDEQVKYHIDFLEIFRDRVIEASDKGMTPNDFIEAGLVPKMDLEKADQRVETAVTHFFKYYG